MQSTPHPHGSLVSVYVVGLGSGIGLPLCKIVSSNISRVKGAPSTSQQDDSCRNCFASM